MPRESGEMPRESGEIPPDAAPAGGRRMELTGSSAIVTGAASGIGAACARQLAARGATVVVADLQADKGEALAAEIKGVFAQVDVTKTEQITAAVNAAAEIAPLRAVVNSAG